MNKDRGIVKWLPFNSLVSNKEVLYKVLKDKERQTRPILSDDEISYIEKSIINAYYTKDTIKITYYKNGYLYEEEGNVKKIDSPNKLIYFNNLKLLFNQIIEVLD